ncbi:MAG: hypothetical protein RLZZ171_1931, partial [Cyanobacteriota bacterium]
IELCQLLLIDVLYSLSTFLIVKPSVQFDKVTTDIFGCAQIAEARKLDSTKM